MGNTHFNNGYMAVIAGILATAIQNGLALPGRQKTIDSCKANHHKKIHSAVQTRPMPTANSVAILSTLAVAAGNKYLRLVMHHELFYSIQEVRKTGAAPGKPALHYQRPARAARFDTRHEPPVAARTYRPAYPA